jgi:hypothetical protein
MAIRLPFDRPPLVLPRLLSLSSFLLVTVLVLWLPFFSSFCLHELFVALELLWQQLLPVLIVV